MDSYLIYFNLDVNIRCGTISRYTLAVENGVKPKTKKTNINLIVTGSDFKGQFSCDSAKFMNTLIIYKGVYSEGLQKTRVNYRQLWGGLSYLVTGMDCLKLLCSDQSKLINGLNVLYCTEVNF